MSNLEEQRDIAHDIIDNSETFLVIAQTPKGQSQMIDSDIGYTERFGLLKQARLVLQETFKSTIMREEGDVSE